MDSPSRTDEMLVKVAEALLHTSNITALDQLAWPPNANVQLRTLKQASAASIKEAFVCSNVR